LELFSEICAPHANFDASVTILTYKVCTFSGGNQERPCALYGIFYQNFSNSNTDLWESLTEVFGDQPGLEFKLAYNEVKWKRPAGKAKHVLYKYPTI
jgi:hypothetical protein